MPDYVLRMHLWVSKKDGRAFLGPGRVLLLRKIDELGSIRAAAKALNMSYRRAWRHVEALNREAPCPLVLTATGGKGGGGARLTPAARKLLAFFEKVERNLRLSLEEKTRQFEKLLKNF